MSLVLLLVFSTMFIAGCTQQQPVTPTPSVTTTPTTVVTAVPAGQSTLIIAVKDAPKTTDVGTITHLWLNISEVSVHPASANQTITDTNNELTAIESDDTNTAGWTVIVNQTQSVDLIRLTNVSEVLGQKTIDSGRYTQIRLKIDSGNITVDSTEHALAVPSGMLRLNRGFVLEPDKALKLTLDFNVEKSVIATGTNQYRIQPVIAVLTESA